MKVYERVPGRKFLQSAAYIKETFIISAESGQMFRGVLKYAFTARKRTEKY